MRLAERLRPFLPLTRTVAVVAGSLGLGWLQYLIARAGARAVDRAEGYEGIGVSFTYFVLAVVVLVPAVLLGTQLAGFRYWLSAGLTTLLADAAIVSVADVQPGQGAAAAAAVAMAAVAVPATTWWTVERCLSRRDAT